MNFEELTRTGAVKGYQIEYLILSTATTGPGPIVPINKGMHDENPLEEKCEDRLQMNLLV